MNDRRPFSGNKKGKQNSAYGLLRPVFLILKIVSKLVASFL